MAIHDGHLSQATVSHNLTATGTWWWRRRLTLVTTATTWVMASETEVELSSSTSSEQWLPKAPATDGLQRRPLVTVTRRSLNHDHCPTTGTVTLVTVTRRSLDHNHCPTTGTGTTCNTHRNRARQATAATQTSWVVDRSTLTAAPMSTKDAPERVIMQASCAGQHTARQSNQRVSTRVGRFKSGWF